MRKTAIALLALALALPLMADDKRSEHFSFDGGPIDLLDIEHPVGDLEIIDSPGNTIEIKMIVHCDDWLNCDSKMDDIELSTRISSDTLVIEVEGYPRFGGDISVDLEIRAPRRMSITAEHGVGETTIRGIEGDIEIEAGVGEIEIESNAAAFMSAEIEAGVGDADLRVSGEKVRKKSTFIGGEARWNGGADPRRSDRCRGSCGSRGS